MTLRVRHDRLRACVRALEVVDLGVPVVQPVATALRHALGGMWGTFRLGLGTSNWMLEFVHVAGPGASGVRAERALNDFIPAAGAHFATFNPLRPAPQLRNAILGSHDAQWMATVRQAPVFALHRRLGIDEHAFVRVLLCEGPMLLAWLGGFREEPFRPQEIAALRSLIAPLQRRLRFARLLDGGGSGGLASALDAMPNASFITRDDGTIEHANLAGADLLQRSMRGTIDLVRERIARQCSPSALAPMAVVHSGERPRHVVVFDEYDRFGQERLAHAARAWRLTPRQTQVLDRLVRGDANKDIAMKVGCSARTVEVHVSALLARARVGSRAELVAKFWER
jgi:DNA-binding CsgD family transcriptional regulator